MIPMINYPLLGCVPISSKSYLLFTETEYSTALGDIYVVMFVFNDSRETAHLPNFR